MSKTHLRDRYMLREPQDLDPPRIPPEHLSVYQEISKLNGVVDRMGTQAIKNKCRELQIDNHGVKYVVKRRLKEHLKIEKLSEVGLFVNRNVDFFVVVDFEATCEERNPSDYKHEIIEFPAVLISSSSAEVVDTFHEYIRPLINPVLSTFCTNLTGISQETVDRSESFLNVHEKFLKWLNAHGLGSKFTFCLVTDGPFDMGRFLYLQSQHSSIPYPQYAYNWVNLRKCFSNFYKPSFNHHNGGNHRHHQHEKISTPGLQVMLSSLGMEFEGSPHSGIDDARNIARIVIRLLRDQAYIRINEKIVLGAKSPTYNYNSENRSPPNPKRLQTVVSVKINEAEAWYDRQRSEIQLAV